MERVLIGPARGSVALLAALGLMGFSREGLSAQGWATDLHVGRATYEAVPVDARSSNAALGIRYGMERRTLQILGAVPLSSEDLLWGVASLGERIAVHRGRLEVGFDAGALLHAQRDALTEAIGRGARADLLPVFSSSVGPVIAELRSGGIWYRGRVGGEDWSRTLHQSDLRLSATVGPSTHLSGEVRHVRSGEEAYTLAGLSGWTAVGTGAVWGSVGEWTPGLPGDGPSTAWSAGASVALGALTTLWASLRRDPFDPVFLSSPRTSWGVGVTRRLGGAREAPPPAGAERRRGGRVVLRLPLSEASAPPEVAGDFTGWEPVPMHRYGAFWRWEGELSPGIYHYAFRGSDGEWFVPESVPGRREDGMGGWVAVLLVTREDR